MGLPMYREPSPAGPKSALKSDPSAHARSSIRRQGAIRYRQSRATGGSFPFRSSLPRQLSDEIYREIERESQSTRRQTRSPDDALLDLTSGLTDFARREAGQRLLRDTLRHSQPGRRLRIPRESTLRFETWPTSALLNRSSSGEDASNRQTPENLPFTPRFAPAFAYHSEISSQPHPDVAPPRPDAPSGEEAPGPQTRLLRRVGNRSVSEANQHAASRRSEIDGLGDRQRSFSPEDDPLNDTWETLLTTITPDVHLPSADSSFTSTAASASTNQTRNSSSTRSGNTSQTQPTSRSSSTTLHMILDPYPEFFNPCDFPDFTSDSDTEAEWDLDSRSSAALRRHRARSRLLQYASMFGSTQDSQPPIPTLPSITSLLSRDPAADLDLQQMQAIVERLARREDIPEDWWAAAGLSRTMGRRLGAGEDSPNPTTDNPGNAVGGTS
ncbi:hypothetical protein VTN77DRAFT_1143 [Rasamsonia byssochlamydoides]|uniref:uncharacterized protein n=1 Tax=Rasamsonia byssochlamydoides TaxID=89139 RepID=UPI0037433A23